MINWLVRVIVAAIVIYIVVWVVRIVMASFALPAPVDTLVLLLVGVVCLAAVVRYVGMPPAGGPPLS